MKRLIASVMSLIMILTFIPVIGLSAFAENEQLYTVTFYKDNTKAEILFSKANLKEGDVYQLLFEPTKEGHTFVSWVNAETGEALILEDGNKGYAPAGNAEYYATWKTNTYKLVYRDGNGVFAEYDVLYGTPMEERPIPDGIPTKTAAIFDGWKEPEETTMPAKQVNIEAFWINENLYLNFYINPDDAVPFDSVQYKMGDTISVIEEVPVKDGYTFKGWSVNGRIVTGDFDVMGKNDISAYAVWTANEYKAVFNANGGAFADGSTQKNVSVDYDSRINFTDVPVRSGYTFGGWSPEVGIMDDISGKTFNATWISNEKNYYTAETYVMNSNGEYDVSKKIITADAGVTVTAEYTVEDGFKLNSQKSVISGVVSADNTLVLKVYIDRNTYTFTYVTDGNKTQKSYLYGAEISAIATPVRDGYVFYGWEPEIPLTMPAKDYTVTATWKKLDGDHVHSTKEIVIEATCTESGRKYIACELCGLTIGEMQIIPAKEHEAGEWITVIAPAYDSDGKKVRKCIRCAVVLEEEVIAKLVAPTENGNYSNATVSINNNPVETSLNYGESLSVTAKAKNLPEGGYIEWITEGDGVVITESNGNSCVVKSVSSGTVRLIARVVDKDGNPVKNTAGEEIYDSQYINSKAGIIQKIIAFFKMLFGLTQIKTQSFKYGF